MFTSPYCEVQYDQLHNVVFVKWKKYCSHDDYRAPLEYALEIMRDKCCSYAADTRSGFENHPDDTAWVADYFFPQAAAAGCKYIYFIIDSSNSLKDELEGQENSAEGGLEFRYIFDLDEIE